jgi:putative oxidoreductase
MIKSLLEKNKDFALLISRTGIGMAYVFVHGWAKITKGPELWEKLGTVMSNFGISYVPVFWGFMASVSEFGGGILLILGLFTRTASSFMAFTMFSAVVNHFTKLDPWSRVIYPVEMFSVLILFIFLGAGKYSLDNLFFKKKKI